MLDVIPVVQILKLKFGYFEETRLTFPRVSITFFESCSVSDHSLYFPSAPLNSRSIFVMKNCTYFTVFVHSSRMPLSSSCLSLLNCIYMDSLSPLLANLPHATLSLSFLFSFYLSIQPSCFSIDSPRDLVASTIIKLIPIKRTDDR